MPIDLAMQNLMKTMGEQGIRSFEQMGVTQARDFAATFVDLQARHVVYSGTTAVQTAVLTSSSSLARVPHPRPGHRRRSDPRAVPDPGPHRGWPPSLEFYRAHSSPGAVIQIAPSMLPSEWDEICVHYGIAPDWPWTKLVCQVNDFQPMQSALRVGPVGRDNAREWASVTLRGFGMPEEGLADMLVASVENPNFRPFAAWDGDEMVAAANLFIHSEVGSLNSAATLQTHRNQGAQSALLAARAKEAASTGCRWLVAERPSQPRAPSTRR